MDTDSSKKTDLGPLAENLSNNKEELKPEKDKDSIAERGISYPDELKRDAFIQKWTHGFRLLVAVSFHLTVTGFLVFYFFALVHLLIKMGFMFVGHKDIITEDLTSVVSLFITPTLPFVLLAAAWITFRFRIADALKNATQRFLPNNGS